jgi:hypothetical protein
MSRWITLVCLMAVLFACSHDKRIPADILSEEKMGAVLFEIGMAEAKLENYAFKDTTMNRDSAIRSELEKVLQVHQLTQESFRNSYEFYKARPAVLKVIMDTLYNRSQRSQEKLYGKRPKGSRLRVDTTIKK